jgi:DHA1 family tetracycline resistance protein-like MFS transporter
MLGLSPLFVIFLTILIDLTGYGIIIPLMPYYAAVFQAGPFGLGLLLASFSIMQFIFSPVLGYFSDIVGRKKILLLSIALSFVGFIIFALANSFLALLASRLISGMATETAVAQAYVADITSDEERTTGMGRIGAAYGAGFIIGPAVGGFLSVFGFWAAGLGAAVVTLMNFLFVVFFLPESIPRVRSRAKASNGFIKRLLSTLSEPIIGSILAISFITSLAFSAIPVILPLLGISYFNFGTVETSYIFIYLGLIQILLQGLMIKRIAKKLNEEKLIVLGPLLMMLGTIIIYFSNIAVFFTAITAISIGNGIANTVIPSLISKKAPKEEQGSMLGVNRSISNIAWVPGPLIEGLAFELAGLVTPIFLSAILLVTAFILSCRVFRACKIEIKF